MLQQLELIERVVAEVQAGRSVVVCAVVGTRGSCPQVPGAMLMVDQAMNTLGTLGGGCVEAEVRTRAFELLRQPRASVLVFDLQHDYGWDDGLVCGGHMDIAAMPVLDGASLDPFRRAVDDLRNFRPASIPFHVERQGRPVRYVVHIEREPVLLIAGAGHVGAELARLAVRLEFRVIVIDDRADFANSQRLPPPIETVVGDIEQTLRGYPIDPATYVVIVTRGHRHDQQALAAVVESPARYVGMIGSRQKIRLVFDALAQSGVSAERLQRVHAPIGLGIRAVTVPELAISIAAELISVRRTDRRKVVEGPFDTVAETSA